MGYTNRAGINVATPPPPHRAALHIVSRGGRGVHRGNVPRGTFRMGFGRHGLRLAPMFAPGYGLPGWNTFADGSAAPSYASQEEDGMPTGVPGAGEQQTDTQYPSQPAGAPVYPDMNEGGPLAWIEDHPLLSAAFGGLGLYLLLKKR